MAGTEVRQIQQFTPEQMNLFKAMFSQVGPESFLGKLAGGDPTMFEQMEKPAWKQFGQAQGQLANRFSQFAPGAMSAQRGSGFANAANQQTIDFASELQSKRQELQRQAIMDMMGLSNQLLNQRPYENYLVQKSPKKSFMSGLMGGMAPLAGAFIGGSMGGPFGAVMGAQLGGGFGSSFSGNQLQPVNVDYSNLSTKW